MPEGSASHTYDLLALAQLRFSSLSKAEERLLRSVPTGEVAHCGLVESSHDVSNDPRVPIPWDDERKIRADLVRWLCINGKAAEKIDARGIRLSAAEIVGDLDLSYATVPHPLRFSNCRLNSKVIVQHTALPMLSLVGCQTGSILADGVKVAAGVFLRGGFTTEGEVRFLGAKIGGMLDCSGGQFSKASGESLSADGIRVGLSVILRGASSKGQVRFLGADIGGNLDCDRGSFGGPNGVSLNADNSTIRGNLFFRDGISEGALQIRGASIGGNLELSGTACKNVDSTAIDVHSVNVVGSVLLRGNFSADGRVLLSGARIGGDLSCIGGHFQSPVKPAVLGENAIIGGRLFLSHSVCLDGGIYLFGTRVDGLVDCRSGQFDVLNFEGATIKSVLDLSDIKDPGIASLDLRNSVLGRLVAPEASWPERGKLNLDGCTYDQLSLGSSDAETCLRWLDREVPFSLQPYHQLSRVLREAGDKRGAAWLLYKMEERRRGEQDRSWYSRSWNWILKFTIGYGHRVWLALWWLLGLTILGIALFGFGYLGGAVVPTDKDAYEAFQKQGCLPPYYPQFNPITYSLEHSFPMVNLGMSEHWQPSPKAPATVPALRSHTLQVLRDATIKGRHPFQWSIEWLVRSGLWFQVLAGWVLATLFVAGFTGIVKNDS